MTDEGLLYLITPPGDEIDHGRAIQLDFQWLQTEKFITTETDCTDITAGKYYLAVGRQEQQYASNDSEREGKEEWIMKENICTILGVAGGFIDALL